MLFRDKANNWLKKKSADKLLSVAVYVRQNSYQQSGNHALKINCATRKTNMFRALTLSLSKILGKKLEKVSDDFLLLSLRK